jgi:hypothetical protein
MATFVRFETPYHCDSSRQCLGIFWSAAAVEERADLPEWTREWLNNHSDWFGAHLPIPRRDSIDGRAIFWFRPQSKIVREVWHLVAILREEGVPVSLRRTNLPGRIIYDDDVQVAAIPYGHGRRLRRQKLLRLI